VTATNLPRITLDIRAVELRRGWVGQIVRTGAILWETEQAFTEAEKALDAAYREADRTINTLINQSKAAK
jgi:hypothetical protein